MRGVVSIFLISLIGCGRFVVSPRSCKTKGKYGSHKIENYTHSIQKTYYAFLEDEEVRLADIIDCQKVSELKVSIERKYFVRYKLQLDFKEDHI